MKQCRIRDVSVLCYAQGLTHWSYRCLDDSIAEVTAEGYMNPFRDMLALGDMITLHHSTSGAVRFVGRLHPHVVLVKGE